MSVLIKGMELPAKCRECKMLTYYSTSGCSMCDITGNALARNFKPIPFDERPDWCPLVEIPAPHGDLIDRDALIAQLESDTEQMEEPIAKMFTYAAINDLKHAQIILDAEGSETHADD